MFVADTEKPKKKRSKGKLNKITFDDEIIPKNAASKFIDSQQKSENLSTKTKTHRQKDKVRKPSVEESLQDHVELKQPKLKQKKNKKANIETEPINEEELDEQQNKDITLDAGNPKIEEKESIRARKRKKHEQLLQEKKLKVDLAMQDKCLNYLSQWKYNRNDWKFEKLRQIWLQQNMFDASRIPDKFWETVVEYFSSAKGKIRQTIIDDALKIIDTLEQSTNDDEMEGTESESSKSNGNKIQRAKSIIQSLQE